ncbi:MAG: uracil-DNA glycosylase family protein, partial [Rhodobacteraceae bacterium]|nr:uracil-DNA glycosylase family protein [Paracoccaceae bacterium]
RGWLGLDVATFYDKRRSAMVPLAFCFPGQVARGAVLPPPPRCAALWRARLLAHFPQPAWVLLVGGHAQRWHLGKAATRGVTATVRDWARHAPRVFPLPHPSWRNTGWLRRNPWFEAEVLPALRARLAALLRE